jgi:hemerythrin-like domain-containing protein
MPVTSFEEPADVREMYLVHTVFRREFGALPALVRGVPVGETDRTGVIAEHAELLLTFLEAHHHSEDVHLWPLLLQRAGAEVTPIVDLMREHHRRLDELTAHITLALVGWRAAAPARQRDVLAEALDGLVRLLYEHMSAEEQRVLPLAEKYMTAREWAAMASISGAGLPPEKVPLIFGMTWYEGDPEVIEKILSALPPEARTVLEEQGPREFASHSQLIHGTPTPPRSGPLTA